MQDAVARISWFMGKTSAVLVFSGAAFTCVALAENASPNQDAHAGEQVYMGARCYACHGQYGYGGVGPRFRQDHFLGLSDYMVGQILIGRGVMPSFAQTLDDKQIADVASYIRTSWGNNFGDIQPNQVAQIRNELKEKAPQGPHVTSSEQPPGVPAPPAGGGSPGQALPPPSMR